MSHISKLSQELIDELIDAVKTTSQFSDEAHKNLAACARVCRAFRSPSQRHIYTSISLNDDYGGKLINPHKEFLKILHESPHIASYVGKLTLWVDGSSIPVWINEEEDFIHIMRLINTPESPITTLQINGGGGGTYCEDITRTSDTLAKFMSTNFGSLASLELIRLPIFPLSAVIQCKSIQHLEISDTTLRLELSPHPFELEEVPKLKSISINQSLESLKTLLQNADFYPSPPLDLSCIEIISGDIYEASEIVLLQTLIAMNASSLRTFHMTLTSYSKYSHRRQQGETGEYYYGRIFPWLTGQCQTVLGSSTSASA